MLHKNNFTLEVDLQIHEVTCPGVWLCPHGRLSLEVYLLDTCVQTAKIKPFFPLDFNEQYLFHKTFDGSFHNSHLKGTFDTEYVYMELIQSDCDGVYGGVLASFRCPLEELLRFPLAENEHGCKCNFLELLMQPSKSFPGILSPKIEISTETTIKENLYSSTNMNNANLTTEYGTSKGRTPSPSRKVLCQLRQHSSCKSAVQQRQRPVCHSSTYHKSRKCFPNVQTTKPVFSYRKPEDSLIMRQVQGLGSKKCRFCNEYSTMANILRDQLILTASADDLLFGKCDDLQTKPPIAKKVELLSTIPSSYTRKSYPESCSKYSYYPKHRSCMCGDVHNMNACSVCAKYMYYFDCHCYC